MSSETDIAQPGTTLATLQVTTVPSQPTVQSTQPPVTTSVTSAPTPPTWAPAPDRSFLPYGDSKTVGMGDETKTGGYPSVLAELLSTDQTTWKEAERVAVIGFTVEQMKERIGQDLSGRTDTPDVVLFNLGTNEVEVGKPRIDPEIWKADVLYILDAMRFKWPDVQVYVARIWRIDENGDVTAMDDEWIPDVVAARPEWVHLGIDERTFLPGDDKCYVSDGTHPNHAGYIQTAKSWKEALGL